MLVVREHKIESLVMRKRRKSNRSHNARQKKNIYLKHVFGMKQSWESIWLQRINLLQIPAEDAYTGACS